MAKSIRSKVKKRNRTEMRKNVGDPHQRKLQARCTAKIQKSVAFSAGVVRNGLVWGGLRWRAGKGVARAVSGSIVGDGISPPVQG